MLDFIRNNIRSFAGVLVIGFCVLLMASFSVDDFFGSSRSRANSKQVAVTIDDTSISFAEFDRVYQSYLRLVRDRSFAREQALEAIIKDSLVRTFTKELQLTSSVGQVEEKILQSPVFNGVYDERRFKAFLQQMGVTATQLRDMTRDEIVRDQLQTAFSDLGAFSERELRAAYQEEHSESQFRFAKLNFDDFKSKVNRSDTEKIGKFFEETREKYRRPRAVSFSYISFSPADFRSKVSLSPDEVLSYYDSNRESYVEPSQLQLKKLVFKLPAAEPPPATGLPFELPPTGEDPAAVRAKAGEFAKKLKEGQKLEKVLAELNSSDTAAKPTVEELGWVVPSTVGPNPLRKAAEQLAAGESSEIVELPGQLVILYAEDGKPQREKTFEEVKTDVEATIRAQEAPAYALAQAEEMLQRWLSGGGNAGAANNNSSSKAQSLADFARTNSLKIESTEAPRTASEELPGMPGLVAEVNKMEQGARNVIELAAGTFLVEVTEVKESHIPDLDQVRSQVVEDYVTREARNLAVAAAKDTISRSEKPGSFSATAAAAQFAVEETKATAKGDANGEFFVSPDVRDGVFALAEEGLVYREPIESHSAVYVVELAKRTPADPADFAKKRDDVLREENEQAAGRLFLTLLARLKDSATITPDPSLQELRS